MWTFCRLEMISFSIYLKPLSISAWSCDWVTSMGLSVVEGTYVSHNEMI